MEVVKISPITAPPVSTPKVMRQDSSNFNMVLQEYHVGHHGHSHHGHSHFSGKLGLISFLDYLENL